MHIFKDIEAKIIAILENICVKKKAHDQKHFFQQKLTKEIYARHLSV